jgi:hypothetical protein
MARCSWLPDGDGMFSQLLFRHSHRWLQRATPLQMPRLPQPPPQNHTDSE